MKRFYLHYIFGFKDYSIERIVIFDNLISLNFDL